VGQKLARQKADERQQQQTTNDQKHLPSEEDENPSPRPGPHHNHNDSVETAQVQQPDKGQSIRRNGEQLRTKPQALQK
jgi:hypothetical protein